MKITEAVVGGKICRMYSVNAPEYIIIQPTGEHEIEHLDEEVRMIQQKSNKPVTFVSFQITDWNREISPWVARHSVKNTSGTEQTLL